MKERWREVYFRMKLEGKNPELMTEEQMDESQKSPDKLWLTVMAKSVEEADVQLAERHVTIASQKVNLHLLRAILPANSTVQVKKTTVDIVLKKAREEPCWLRLLKSTKENKAAKWLKRDLQRARPEDCQHMKERWREVYFRMKLEGKTPELMTEEQMDQSQGSPDPHKTEKMEWDNSIADLRARAIPRTSSKKKQSKKKAKK
jgi:hypothetical protein